MRLPSPCFLTVEFQAPSHPPLAPALDALISLAANSRSPVLLQGEAGTGKNHVARLIHSRSDINQLAFLEIACDDLDSADLVDVLFGTEPQNQPRSQMTPEPARLHGVGTLHLTHVDRLPLAAQARLLSALAHDAPPDNQEAIRARPWLRLIASTHLAVNDALGDGRMLTDLFYRLQSLTLTLPPLRAQPDAILPFARALLQPLAPERAALTPAAEAVLVAHAWPGNLRELRDTLWRASVLAQDAPIDAAHLATFATPASRATSTQALDAIERDAIRTTLKTLRGNRTRTARALGIARSTLLEKIKRYGLS